MRVRLLCISIILVWLELYAFWLDSVLLSAGPVSI